MPTYILSETDLFSTSSINANMFGANFVSTFDFEFTQNSGALDLLSELGITVLRFPGGTVTEMQFADSSFMSGNWEVDTYLDSHGNIASLTTLHDFIMSASTIGADVQLVIPTRVAFEQSAGQALRSGTYGDRTKLDENYFDWLDEFVRKALSEGQSAGVEIIRFEIGNEFWGSGQMTASEYGYLAAEVTAYLSEKFPDVEILAQVVASTNEYSPLGDKTVYLEPIENGDFIVHTGNISISGTSSDWVQATMSGQGNVTSQVEAIAEQFNSNSQALNGLTGIVDHVYFDAGFAGIDGERDFALNYPYAVFSNTTGLTDLDYHATEWSPRNAAGSSSTLDGANASAAGNANGLQLAHTTIEAFFELSSNGVDGANFWPLTFANPNIDGRVLIDTSELDITFSGATLQMLANSVSGLVPFLDFEISNVIDVHGFRDASQTVLFVGERSGNLQNGNLMNLDIGEFALGRQYFVNVTILSSDNGSFDQINSDPIVDFQDGYVLNGNTITMGVESWGLNRVELQAITSQDDQIFGRDGDDSIVGLGGNDIISGAGGSNRLNGGEGHDTALFAGNQSDYIINQSQNNPSVWFVSNGEETDTLTHFEALQFEDAMVYLAPVNGNDLFPGSSSSTSSFVGGSNVNYVFSAPILGSVTGDTLKGNSANNFLVTDGRNDQLFGYRGNDRIDGGGGSDRIYGGTGNDTILGREGDDWTDGGYGNDVILTGDGNDVARGWTGNDDINGGNGDDQVFGETGDDRLQGYNGNDRLDGGDGDNKLFGQSGDDRLIAGSGQDSLYGGGGNDLIVGRTGDDRLEGGAGYDKLLGGDGSDVLTGQQGEDHLEGSYGDDFLFGGGENDFLAGQQGNDRIEGGSGADRIFGGGGNDILVGNQNNDFIHGGIGSDFLLGGSGADILNGFTGNDRLEGSYGNDILLGGYGADVLAGHQDHDWLDGGNGNDQLFGGAGHDVLLGQGGHDHLFGMVGNDQLYGGSGNDTIFAGSGRNLLSGGSGNDKLHGGQGPDQFEFNGGADEIFNFDVRLDTITIESDLWSGNLSPSDLGSLFGSENASGVLLDFGGGNSLQINSIADIPILDDLIAFM